MSATEINNIEITCGKQQTFRDIFASRHFGFEGKCYLYSKCCEFLNFLKRLVDACDDS